MFPSTMFFFYLLPFFSSRYHHHVCRALDTVRDLPSDVERLCDRLQLSLRSPLHRSKTRVHPTLVKSVGNLRVSLPEVVSSFSFFSFFSYPFLISFLLSWLPIQRSRQLSHQTSNHSLLYVRVLFRRELDRQCDDRRDRCFANRRYRVRDTPRLIDLYLDHHALVFSRDEYRVHKIDNQVYVLQTEARLSPCQINLLHTQESFPRPPRYLISYDICHNF